MRAAVLALALIVLAPSAAAHGEQDWQLVFPPEGRLMPETELAQAQASYSVLCSSPPRLDATNVNFTITDLPAYATAVLNPSLAVFDIPPTRCTDPEYGESKNIDIFVTTSRDAPAFRTFVFHVVATSDSTDDNVHTIDVPVTNDYIAQVQADPDSYFQKIAPGENATFRIALENQGNGATTSSATIVDDGSGALTIDRSPDVALASHAQDGPDARVRDALTLVVHAHAREGYVNEIHSFNVTIRSHSSEEPQTQPDESLLVFSVQVQGGHGVGDALAPSIDPVALLVGLAVGFALYRRRQTS